MEKEKSSKQKWDDYTSDFQDEDIPVFHAPGSEKKDKKSSASQDEDIPIFHAPGSEEDIPIFHAPGSDEEGIPVFHSPGGGQNRQACSYHPHNAAVANCQICGKPLCESCMNITQNDEGCICYDCAKKTVEEENHLAMSRRNRIIIRPAIVVTGIICSIIAGLSVIQKGSSYALAETLLWVFLIAFITSIPISFKYLWKLLKKLFGLAVKLFKWRPVSLRSLFTGSIGATFAVSAYLAVKLIAYVTLAWLFYVGIVVSFFISPFVALYIVIRDLIKFVKVNNLIKRNEELLKNMTDHMEFINILFEEKITADELAHDVRMQNNQFAQYVAIHGYEGASKGVADDAKEFAENDREIKKFYKQNEYGELVRVS